MKHFSYLLPKLPQPATPHAKRCMEKIREILAREPAYKKPEQTERIPGSDDEEQEGA